MASVRERGGEDLETQAGYCKQAQDETACSPTLSTMYALLQSSFSFCFSTLFLFPGTQLTLLTSHTGSVSAGVWSTIVTRVLTLLINGLKGTLAPLFTSSESKAQASGVPGPGVPEGKISEISEKGEAKKAGMGKEEGSARRRTGAARAGEKEL